MKKMVIDFIKSPLFSPIDDRKLAISLFFRTLGLYLLLLFPLTILIAFTILIAKMFGFEYSFFDTLTNYKNDFGINLFLLVGLYAPCLEETAFRLWLSFKKTHISIGLAVLVFAFGNSVIEIDKNQLVSLFILLGFSLTVGVFLLIFIKQSLLSKWQERYGKAIVYFISLLFVFIHIFNHSPLYFKFAGVYLIFLLPILLLTILITFLRMRVGFFAGVIFHILVNSCSLLLSS